MRELIANRYELGSIVGTGGMSVVYAATDNLLGREIAIKMLREDLAQDANFRQRFRKEAQNAGRLNHQAIVSVYDTGETMRDGVSTPYIVMELVKGRNLREIVRDGGPLSPDEAATTLIPVCEALQVSHDAGIIHRDIKPANIMITNTGVVKIMDFGIARALDDATSAMTQTSAVIGTAQYLSPEQARGKPVDGRSDIYSLGCVMYEMLTGQPPFDGDTPFSVAYQHVQENPAPPSEFIADLSPNAAVNVDAVVLTAMAKHPGDRYQSAVEMASDLQRLERNAVTMAARHYVDPAQLESDEAPTTPLGPAETSLVPAVASGAVANSPQPARAAARRHSESVEDFDSGRHYAPEQKRSRNTKILAGVAAVVVLALVGAFSYDYFTSNLGNVFGISREEVTVPDLANKTEEEATAELEKLNLKVEVEKEASPTVESGHVVRTNPTANSSVRSGSTITLTVSAGKEITGVPDLTGKTTAEASALLKKSGLELESVVREEASDTVKEGQIMEQTPSAGTQVAKGSKVTITVSTGAGNERVPVLTGMKWSQAEGNLTALGFKPIVETVDGSQPEGTVIFVEGEGTEMPAKSQIRVQVSNGQMVSMPSITGMTIDDALSTLHSAGWKGSRSNISVGDTVKTGSLVNGGRIANQSPGPGEPVTKDGTVTVQLWEFDISSIGQ